MTFAYNNTLTGVGYLDGLTITCHVVGPGYAPLASHATTAALTDVITTEDAVAEVIAGSTVVVRIPSDQVTFDLGGETDLAGFVWSDPDDRLLFWFDAVPGIPADPLTVTWAQGLNVVDQGA